MRVEEEWYSGVTSEVGVCVVSGEVTLAKWVNDEIRQYVLLSSRAHAFRHMTFMNRFTHKWG